MVRISQGPGDGKAPSRSRRRNINCCPGVRARQAGDGSKSDIADWN